jgi:hypothetical protein
VPSFECGGLTPLLRFLFDSQKKSRSATGESSVEPEHSKVLSFECGGSTPLLRFLFDSQKKSRSATGESSARPEHSKVLSFECGGSTPLLHLFGSGKAGVHAGSEFFAAENHAVFRLNVPPICSFGCHACVSIRIGKICRSLPPDVTLSVRFGVLKNVLLQSQKQKHLL